MRQWIAIAMLLCIGVRETMGQTMPLPRIVRPYCYNMRVWTGHAYVLRYTCIYTRI